MMAKGASLEQYSLSQIMSIVSSIGTLVNSDSTSMKTMMPKGREPLIRSRNSSDDLRLYDEGINGESSSFSRFARVQVTVVISLMIGRSGELRL